MKEIKLEISDFIKSIFYLIRAIEPNIKYFRLEKIIFNQKIEIKGDTDEGKVICIFKRNEKDMYLLHLEKLKLIKENILYPYPSSL